MCSVQGAVYSMQCTACTVQCALDVGHGQLCLSQTINWAALPLLGKFAPDIVVTLGQCIKGSEYTSWQ